MPIYLFEMRLVPGGQTAGDIALRVANTEHIGEVLGHVGYGVRPEHRGHRYAARSLRLLLPLARRHGLDPLWVTCPADNAASRRTCEIAGGILAGVRSLENGTRMCRYRFDLGHGHSGDTDRWRRNCHTGRAWATAPSGGRLPRRAARGSLISG